MDQTVRNASLVGTDLLDDPAHTKDTAFSAEERKVLRLEGLLPHSVETLDRFDKGLATVERPKDIRAFVESKLYKPVYAGNA